MPEILGSKCNVRAMWQKVMALGKRRLVANKHLLLSLFFTKAFSKG